MNHHRSFWLTVLVLLPSIVSAQDVVHDRDEAAAILGDMVGTWQIERENAPVGVPSIYGVRTIRSGLDEFTLEWDERQESGTASRGFIGYDPLTGSYYMMGVHDHSNLRVSFLKGTPQGDGREIRWDPVDVGNSWR
jgi:hypothetical protein